MVDETKDETTNETAPEEVEEVPRKSRRGFASMTAEMRRELGQRGGRKRAASGTLRRWTSEEARIAGSKGGKAPRRRRGEGAT
ncbi:MAG: hypothetical protein KF850_22425 [Labilithrix sp.]|nr:hypothetical protein [Labilithrix sp.]